MPVCRELFPVVMKKHPDRAFTYQLGRSVGLTNHFTCLFGPKGVEIIRWMRKYHAACIGDAVLWFITKRHKFEFIDVFVPISGLTAAIEQLEKVVGPMDETVHNKMAIMRLLYCPLVNTEYRLRIFGYPGTLAKTVHLQDINIRQLFWEPNRPTELYVRHLDSIQNRAVAITHNNGKPSQDRLAKYKASGF